MRRHLRYVLWLSALCAAGYALVVTDDPRCRGADVPRWCVD